MLAKSVSHTKSLGFEQSPSEAHVMRLSECGSVSIAVAVLVDDIFVVGQKSRCNNMFLIT